MAKSLDEMIQVIKDVAAGLHVLLPWTGRTIFWNVDDAGNYCFKDYCIASDQFEEFKKYMGGSHIIFSPDKACQPIGTDPEEYNLGKWVKEVIQDIFHPEEKATPTSNSNQLDSTPEPVCDYAIAGFKPSEELIEARRKCDEWNYQINGFQFNTETYQYGIQDNQYGTQVSQ